MIVSQILREKGNEVLIASPDATLFETAKVLSANRIGALLVLNRRGIIAGIISERDIVRAIAELGPDALTMPVASRMTRDVATCDENDPLEIVMETMMRCRFRHMPVLRNGQVTGIISTTDVASTRIAETMREAQALKEYIAAS